MFAWMVATNVAAVEPSPGVLAVASYRGADREQVLYAGAKTEGKIIWYTSLAGDSYKEMVKAFEAKYPGVKVESFRAPGADLVTRLEEEAKARRNIADTIETTEGSLIFLRDGKLQVMAGHSFVIGNGFHVEQQALLGRVFVDVDASGTRAVGAADRVVSGHTVGAAEFLHGNDVELVFRQASEEFRKLAIHLVAIFRVEIEKLLAGLGMQHGILADVSVKRL